MGIKPNECSAAALAYLGDAVLEVYVREYLVNTYVEAAKKWKLDGFKLDFIDRFRTNGKVTPEMDFVSVEDAVECLLSEIHTALTKLNPEMLLEFRQPYYGPVVGAYGNMFRVWDCPLDGVTNKTWSTNLRLCLPNSAIRCALSKRI